MRRNPAEFIDSGYVDDNERPFNPKNPRLYLVSSCCGEDDKEYSTWAGYSEINVCPKCKNSCEFVWEQE